MSGRDNVEAFERKCLSCVRSNAGQPIAHKLHDSNTKATPSTRTSCEKSFRSDSIVRNPIARCGWVCSTWHSLFFGRGPFRGLLPSPKLYTTEGRTSTMVWLASRSMVGAARISRKMQWPMLVPSLLLTRTTQQPLLLHTMALARHVPDSFEDALSHYFGWKGQLTWHDPELEFGPIVLVEGTRRLWCVSVRLLVYVLSALVTPYAGQTLRLNSFHALSFRRGIFSQQRRRTTI